MKKIMIVLAAFLLCGCGDVGEFTRMERTEKDAETLPAFTFAPSAAAEEPAETTSSAEETVSETNAKKKKAATTTKTTEETAVSTTLIGSTPLANTDTKQQTEQPKETYATPTVQPHIDPKNTDEPKQEEKPPENYQEHKDPDFHSDIYQPAWFVSQCFSANWDNYDLLKDGYKAIIRNADDLRAYMEPIYPEDFIQERINFYTKEIFYGEDFFDNNVLIVNTLSQGSGTEPMAQIDRIEPSDSMINIKYSWKYEDDCAYAEVMSVCFLQVTAAKPYITDNDARPKGIIWTMIDKSKSITPGRTDCYTLTDEDKSIFAQLNCLNYTPVTCDGLPEYTLQAPDGTFYQINLSGKWVWKNMKDEEAQLPDELVSWLCENGERIGMNVATWN
ncbi:MAG: hypothetical protein K6B74_02140 [Ruminococcus sp.]|nr:hypothetical protein [Ruminococcus sp.]